MKTCKHSHCNKQAEKGYNYCATCRARRRRHSRANQARRRADRTPARLAYEERHRERRTEATKAWIAKNQDRKRLISRLQTELAAGRIRRPSRCADCRLPKAPLVAWGLAEGAPVTVECFLCWGCWWRRRRVETGEEE